MPLEREEPPTRTRSGAAVWLVLLLIAAALVYGAYTYRRDIVALWPATARIYSALGISSDGAAAAGLRIVPESIRFQQEAQNGVPALIVSGQIVNGSDRAARLAPIQIMLLGKDRTVMRTEPVKLEDRALQPGEKFEFRARIANPPAEVQSVRILFAGGAN
jgi:hypothetical protein